MQLPDDVDAFHAVLKRRIRDQRQIDALHLGVPAEDKVAAQRVSTAARETRHVVGQSGCFCMECLLHRRQEWRIGDINTAIVGPRDEWRQYTWGNGERQSLYSENLQASSEPVLTQAITEKIRVHDVSDRIFSIERDAKFVAVASGQYHTLMLSESAAVFSSGDNSYGALGIPAEVDDNVDAPVSCRPIPAKVEAGLSSVNGCVKIIAASGFASFALVVLPVENAPQRPASKEGRQNRGRLSSIERIARGRLSSIDRVRSQSAFKAAMGAVSCNHLFSWGRGHHGVLGHGDTKSSSVPRILTIFNAMRVIGVSAGLQHVLVLTELDGVYAFGDGSNGKLGMGDTSDRLSPTRILGLDGLNVVHISAGDEHSIAMSGETFFNRQVYSWGLGTNGRLGHNDELNRPKPTRVNFFRGRKVITVAAGGAHNLAISDMPQGVCVWSWGSGAYGQLGHRDTWDAFVPRSVDEIRHESIRFIDAGQRHSLAISESKQLWLWGQGVHGDYHVPDPDASSTSILCPIKIELPDLTLVSARAGRGRTFVWGDRAIEREKPRSFGGSDADSMCCALPEYESLTSDSFRIIFRCGPCHFKTVCIACAHHCHVQHCLELAYSMKDTLSRHCDCFNSGKCEFAEHEHEENGEQ